MTNVIEQHKEIEKIRLLFKPDYSTFYNVNRLFSYNDISTYILIGGRGIGKTTGVLLNCIANFNNRKEQFVIIRRYKNELSECRGIFDKISKDIVCKGTAKKGKLVYYYKGEVIGYALALVVQAQFKSGTNFDAVTRIIYDECTVIRGSAVRYLSNEIHQFFELLSTIVRTRKNYKIFIVGNNNDVFNPYVEFFDINIKLNPYVDIKRGLYFEYCENSPKLLEIEKETPMYRLTLGTTYHDYHYGNKVLVDDNIIIGVKDANATFICRLLFNKTTLNVYIQDKGKVFIEYKDKIINDSYTYKIMENSKYNIYYCKLFLNGDAGKYISRAFYTDDIIYQEDKCYNILKEFISLS